MRRLATMKAPNTYLILASLLVIVAALTWVVPAAEYGEVEKDGRMIVDPNAYTLVERSPQGFTALLTAPIRGFINAAEIIAFVLIVGGAFGVFRRTGAIDDGIRKLVIRQEGHPWLRQALIPVFMLIFSLGGAVFGMSEEVIPFILIFIPLALKLGYDSITGVAIPFVGAGAGFAGAFLNPFTVGIAQGIADLPLFSGMGYRFICWVLTTSLAIYFVMRHAERVRRDPTKSPVHELDRQRDETDEPAIEVDDDARHGLVLGLFALSMVVLVVGVLQFHWYIQEIAALFLVAGLVVGWAGRLSVDGTVDAFIGGAKDLVGTALVIGLARGILILAESGHIIAPTLHGLSELVAGVPAVLAGWIMFISQTVLNFLVPSGSGQAVLTMPIMAPLGDILGVSRQTVVLAYQFGDGFGNMIIPTSPVTMSVLMLANIPWTRWAAWLIKLELLFLLLGLLLLIPPYFLNW